MKTPFHTHLLILMFLGYGEPLILAVSLFMVGEYGQCFTILGALFQPLAIGYYD